jgi:2-methylcitrate synthase
MPYSAHPMDASRSLVSTLGAFDSNTSDNSREANLSKSVRLIAKVPTVIAIFDRLRRGEPSITPDQALSHAGYPRYGGNGLVSTTAKGTSMLELATLY